MTHAMMLLDRSGVIAAALVAALMSATAAAQNVDGAGAGGGPPARIGNHYDYRDYQPTPDQVCSQDAGGKQGGINCPSAAGSATQRELSDIQRQIDASDAKYPPGYLENSDGTQH
jgi:hypothetical protein